MQVLNCFMVETQVLIMHFEHQWNLFACLYSCGMISWNGKHVVTYAYGVQLFNVLIILSENIWCTDGIEIATEILKHFDSATLTFVGGLRILVHRYFILKDLAINYRKEETRVAQSTLLPFAKFRTCFQNKWVLTGSKDIEFTLYLVLDKIYCWVTLSWAFSLASNIHLGKYWKT